MEITSFVRGWGGGGIGVHRYIREKIDFPPITRLELRSAQRNNVVFTITQTQAITKDTWIIKPDVLLLEGLKMYWFFIIKMNKYL